MKYLLDWLGYCALLLIVFYVVTGEWRHRSLGEFAGALFGSAAREIQIGFNKEIQK